MSRLIDHPILDVKSRKAIPFSFEGEDYEGLEGDTIASALVANGIVSLSTSIKKHRPRGFYCAIGNCASCEMSVNGVAHVRTCITPLEANMVITKDEKGHSL
jgi:predicted molibdopterin-dependent oxidoreductase YjgC